LYGRHRAFDIWVAKYEAEQAIWRGELERASSAIQLGLAAVGNAARWAEAEIMLCAAGLAVQAARAEQARAASDAPVVADAIAVGRSFLHGAHSVVEPHGRSWHPNVHPRNVHLRAWLAKAEAEWTRLQGSSSPAHWQTAVEAFSFGHAYEVARCRWRLACQRRPKTDPLATGEY
jgi:hypothetical protein